MNITVVLLSALALGSGASLAYLWIDPATGQLVQHAWARPAPVKPDLPGLEQRPEASWPRVDAGAFGAMIERPLFAVDRRVPPPPKAAGEAPADPLDTLRLVGVFSGERAGVIADVGGRTRRVQVNDKVGDWTLNAVEQRDAVFVRGDEKRTVQLAYSRWGSAPRPLASARPQGATALTAQTPESERARILQEQEAERWRVINEIRAKAGMLRP